MHSRKGVSIEMPIKFSAARRSMHFRKEVSIEINTVDYMYWVQLMHSLKGVSIETWVKNAS